MRWLSLIAVLGGCTLITDPSSYEGEPRDAGTSDADANGIDAMPDAGCTENDLDRLRACVDGSYIECDRDGDGFIPEAADPACGDLDRERGLPPYDCDDEFPARRHGLHSCVPAAPPLDTCVGEAFNAFGGVNAGEIAFDLGLLVPSLDAPAPPTGSVDVIARGFGQYEVYFLDACVAGTPPGCQQLHRLRFEYRPVWMLDAESELLELPAAEGLRLSIVANQTEDQPMFAVATGAMATGVLAIFEDEVSGAPVQLFNGAMTPFMDIDDASGTLATAAWLSPGDGKLLLNLATDGERRMLDPVRALSLTDPHPVDVSGSHVVLLGDDGEQQYWAAPPIGNRSIGANCSDASGCITVRVGASDLRATTLQPNGAPSVVAGNRSSALGIFPATEGLTPAIYLQELSPRCAEDPGECGPPVLLEDTTFAQGIHDAVVVRDRVYLAYQRADRIVLSVFDPTPTPDAVMTLPLFNDGLVSDFGRVDAIRLVVQRNGSDLEIGVLVVTEGAWYLDILRTCNAAL